MKTLKNKETSFKKNTENMTEIRTVLLLGRTGNGKSTTANVMSNTNKFAESEYGVSETRGIQEGYFQPKGGDIVYHIIDTIGIGDTRFNEREVLLKLAEATNAIKGGLNQIFFVTSGRFTEEEIRAYNLLRTVFFAEDIGEYTTIVRTKFPSFRKPEKCRLDKEKMIAENEDVADIIRSCKKLIHVNNLTEEEDPELKFRKECREILRSHLKFNCNLVYRPQNLDDLNDRTKKHMDDREKTKKQMDDLEEKLRQAEERAKNGDKDAKKRQKELEETLKNLANQQAEREEKLAKIMAEQMNSKLNEVKEGYSKVVDELKGSMNYLINELNKKDKRYDDLVKNQQKVHEDHVNQLKEMKPEVQVVPICKIM